MRRLRRKLARPAKPNAGIEAEYRRRIMAMVREMADSVEFWMQSAYRQNPPATVALDANAADEIQAAWEKLAKRWRKNIDNTAPKLARWFATAVEKRSTAQLHKALRDGGFSVKFQMGKAARDIIDATTHQNVALIKSIPAQYLTDVEGLVMRSIQEGRNLGPLAKELQKRYPITKRRAALIARDQNNKATAAITRARQMEHSLKAIWRHSHAGKEPRPTHVANDGKAYDPVRGWYDPAIRKRIWPGTEINCRCTSQTIVPGFE